MTALVRSATVEDAAVILPHVIQKQQQALAALPGGELDGLRNMIRLSERTFFAALDDEPCCLGGVIRSGTSLAPVGMMWMTITPNLARIPKQFLRDSRAVVRGWTEIFPVLLDFVDVEKTSTLRWLRWLGFQVFDPIPGAHGNMVHPVELRAWA